MALTGLVIFVVSMALPRIKISEIDRANVEIDGEISLLKKEQEWRDYDSYQLQKKIDEKRESLSSKIDEAKNLPSLSKTDIEQLHHKMDELVALTDEGWGGIISRSRDELRKSVAIKIKQNLKDQQLKEAQIYLDWMRYGAGLGAILSFFGFYLWYSRSQRFIDAELKQRVKPTAPPVRRLLKSKSRE